MLQGPSAGSTVSSTLVLSIGPVRWLSASAQCIGSVCVGSVHWLSVRRLCVRRLCVRRLSVSTQCAPAESIGSARRLSASTAPCPGGTPLLDSGTPSLRRAQSHSCPHPGSCSSPAAGVSTGAARHVISKRPQGWQCQPPPPPALPCTQASAREDSSTGSQSV
eukprot:169346-Chlamydomonas_euryale.AAC.11